MKTQVKLGWYSFKYDWFFFSRIPSLFYIPQRFKNPYVIRSWSHYKLIFFLSFFQFLVKWFTFYSHIN